MRFDDFARPEHMLRMAVKLFAIILALVLAPALLQVLLRAVPGLAVVLAFAMLSFAAYAMRQGDRKRSRRTQQTGGAERTPLLPTVEEEF